jgi:hypothetical protein
MRLKKSLSNEGVPGVAGFSPPFQGGAGADDSIPTFFDFFITKKTFTVNAGETTWDRCCLSSIQVKILSLTSGQCGENNSRAGKKCFSTFSHRDPF